MRAVLLLLPLLLVACGGGDEAGSGSDSGTDALAGTRPADELVVEQDLGDGSDPQRWTLSCAGGGSGDHPDPQAACAHLAGLADPFAPLPDDRVCAEVYGGPQTAQVTGTWQGEPVSLSLSRVDGCAAAQWDGLGPLLPGPVPAGGAPDDPQ